MGIQVPTLTKILGVNTKMRNLGDLTVGGGETKTKNIPPYCAFVFIVNQSSGQIALLAASYGKAIEVAKTTSAGDWGVSCNNRTLSITNNDTGALTYSISYLI